MAHIWNSADLTKPLSTAQPSIHSLSLVQMLILGSPQHPVYFWPKLTRRLEEGSHQVAIFQIVMVVIATKRSQGDPGSAKSMHAKTDILTH